MNKKLTYNLNKNNLTDYFKQIQTNIFELFI